MLKKTALFSHVGFPKVCDGENGDGGDGHGVNDSDDIIALVLVVVVMGCTQIPISTLSHIWVFVRLYGIVYVIIVIIIIIIMII